MPSSNSNSYNGPWERTDDVDDQDYSHHNNNNPLIIPPIHTWELNENSTRYDYVVASPSNHDRILMWSLWSTLSFISAIIIILVFFGMLFNYKVRNNPFNQYLLFLMTPDLVYAILCGITCTLNATHGKYYSAMQCYLQSWYGMFAVSGSAYMNSLLAHEVYKMLLHGQNCRRHTPPTSQQIIRNSIFVISIAAFVSSWSVFSTSGILGSQMEHVQTISLFAGIGCLPVDFNAKTSLFQYLVYFPCLIGIPMGYVMYLCFQIWHKQMLPRRGKRRELANFFLRLALIYIVMWIPCLLFSMALSKWVPSWIEWFGAAIAHLQGISTASFVYLSKSDIRHAVKDLLWCNCKSTCFPCDDDTTTANKRTKRRRRIWVEISDPSSLPVASCTCKGKQSHSHSSSSAHQRSSSSYGNNNICDGMGQQQQQQDVEDSLRSGDDDSRKGTTSVAIGFALDMQPLSSEKDDEGADCICSVHLDTSDSDEYSVEKEDIDDDEEEEDQDSASPASRKFEAVDEFDDKEEMMKDSANDTA